MNDTLSFPFAASALVLLSLAASTGCSSDDGADAPSAAGAGGDSGAAAGTGYGSGGVELGTGGAQLGTGGGQLGTGGDQLGTGGSAASGGNASSLGGATPGSGGATPGSGGATPGSGGATPGSGGTTPGSGGTTPGSGGTTPGSGGATAGAGAGGSTTGDAGSGGAGIGGAQSVDPTVAAAIEIDACMEQLPWGATDLTPEERAPIVTAIINTCREFAPPGEEWQQWCQMFLVAAINAESSYNVLAGTQGAGGDPTIGLLQIRFSSTIVDFAEYGPVDALERIGCDFGTVTESDSYATKGDMMADVNCNVAIGAWYYFIFGSGNGGSEAVWVWEYCRSRGGIAGNLHIGMACHLMGAEAAHSSLSGADFYYEEIKSWFDPCVSYSGTHPFERTIEPDVGKYCG